MRGASGRQKRAPLAAGAQNVHAVDHLAERRAVCRRRACPAGSRLDMRPFRIGQVARITQFVAVVAVAVHMGHLANSPPRESQLIQLFKRGRRITDSRTHGRTRVRPEKDYRVFGASLRSLMKASAFTLASPAAVEPGDGAFDHPRLGWIEALHPIGSLSRSRDRRMPAEKPFGLKVARARDRRRD